MPWINPEMCTGCRLCIDQCPVKAIEFNADGFVGIAEAECIGCGHCHDVCPGGAVRYDGERIPQEVAKNLQWVRVLLGQFHEPKEQSALMERMVWFFNKQQKVNERTLAEIAKAENDPAESLDAAIRDLLAGRAPESSKE
jgi:NAD-dependent dihydropyrimidine dehydrogenase PreA subunit